METLAAEIEAIYRSQLAKPVLYYGDCRKIAALADIDVTYLTAYVDDYVDTTAGYSSSASRLHLRNRAELAIARQRMARGLFDIYPAVESCEALITIEIAPALATILRVTDEARALLTLLLAGIEARSRGESTWVS